MVAGRDLGDMGSREQTRYLRHIIGFVWQQTSRNLLPYLTALENVALPMVLDGIPARTGDAFARELLDEVGLAIGPTTARSAMSGGEQQRVAIAVALANRPEVLLADEPTGELDTATAHQIFDLFRRLNQDLGVTIVIATHDPLVSDQVDRTVAIRDGRVSSEVLRHRTLSEAGDHHVVATEYAVLDRAGRLQLPRAHVEALGLERAGPARARGRPHRGLAGSAVRRAAARRTAIRRPTRERRPSDQPVRPAGRRHDGTARRAPRSWSRRAASGRDFLMGSTVVHALADVDLRVERGELVAVRGRSGSGKTTLLSLIGGLDRPTAGQVVRRR